MDINMEQDQEFRVSVGENDTNGRTRSKSQHEEKFKVYNEALLHAAACQDSQCQANNGRCNKVKASIDHFVRCYGPRRGHSPIESCMSCSKIWGLLCFHAKYCPVPFKGHCVVSQCDYLRDKIAKKREMDQWELQQAKKHLESRQNMNDWPVERRIAQVEADRQQVMQVLATLRAQKAQYQQQQEQYQQQNQMAMQS